MSSFAVLRAKKLKTKSQISGSARHTFRDILPPNSDPMRSGHNQYSRIQSAENLLSAIEARLPGNRRKDAVLAIEYLVGASPEWFVNQGPSAGAEYFRDAVRWLAQRHGAENIVAWAVHRDESTPHLVCYAVPLDPQTNRLNAKRWLGGRQKLSQMQTEFANTVARPHGLERGIQGSRATHHKVQQWYGQIVQPDPALKFTPQDVQLRHGETPAMLADRLTAKTATELRPTFSAAKITRSARRLAKELVSTAKAHQHRHDQLVRLCAPVLKLHNIDEQAFDALMEWVRQRLEQLQREATIRLERARPSHQPRAAPRAPSGSRRVTSQYWASRNRVRWRSPRLLLRLVNFSLRPIGAWDRAAKGPVCPNAGVGHDEGYVVGHIWDPPPSYLCAKRESIHLLMAKFCKCELPPPPSRS
jgi:hypothetical protein